MRRPKYQVNCPVCQVPDRVTRKGLYHSKGPGYHRMVCQSCKTTFTRYIPQSIGLGEATPPPAPRQKLPTGRGENHSQSKLTQAQVKDIVSLIDSGSEPQELAERYGVAKPTIVAIVRGDTWSHVTGIEPANPRLPRAIVQKGK